MARTSLEARTSLRVLDGFGGAVRAACRHAVPRSVDELCEVLAAARRAGLTVGFRGAGRSYGDAAMNSRGLVVDTRQMDRLLRWEPTTGVLEAEAGLTIEGLWRRTIEDGFWPHVVPGTMKPTLGGCVSTNIHGKNNYRAGTFGEHVLELDLVTVGGDVITCSRTREPDVFHAALGGIGLLGAVTRVKMELKHVGGGRLRVMPLAGENLGELFALFDAHLPTSDYLVGWVDCMARGPYLGRGELHTARYAGPDDDPLARESLHVERQGLPGHILGVPRSQIWRILRLLTNDTGIRLLNEVKYQASWLGHRRTYFQSHVAFAFLLDYVPDWRLAYGSTGFIQYQIFVPAATALECMRDVLRMSQRAGIHSYLGVLKRHRPDPFVLSHGLDGWSLALDFPVAPHGRPALWKMTESLTERVLEAGGTFYFAKDAVLRAQDVERAYGRERLERFRQIKARLDPEGVLASDLSMRSMPGLAKRGLADAPVLI